MDESVPAAPALDRTDALCALGLALLAAAALAIAVSGQGPGLYPDSLVYADTAEHMAAGDGAVTDFPDGVRNPLVTWPPLYPLALSPGPLLGGDVQTWALWLHCLLFAVLASGSFLVLRWAGVLRGHSACGAALGCFAGAMLQYFHAILSEALFLPLWLSFAALLARALVDPRRRWVVAAGLCAAAATLTRYVAQGAIPAATLLLLLYPLCGPWRARLARASLFFACAQLPVLLWLARNWLVADSVAQRDIALQAVQVEWFVGLWRVATTWFAPESLNRWPRHAVLVLVVAVFGAALKGALAGPEAARRRALAAACAVCAAGYLALMFGAEFGASRAQDLDQRMLLPVLLPVALVLAVACSGPTRLHRLLTPAIALLALVALGRSSITAIDLHQQGAAYSSVAWKADLNAPLPPGLLASNHAEALGWTQRRPCFRLPPPGPDRTALDPQRKAKFLRDAAGRPVTIVLFDRPFPWDAPPELLVRELGLREVARDGGRTVYLMPARPVE